MTSVVDTSTSLGTHSEEPRKLVLAAATSLLPTTVWLAERHGCFAAYGLEAR